MFDRKRVSLIETIEFKNSVFEDALKKIANGEGYYGAQAREYKQIAKDALQKAEISHA